MRFKFNKEIEYFFNTNFFYQKNNLTKTEKLRNYNTKNNYIFLPL